MEPPDAFKVTDDMHPEAEKMLYGRSVTFTFQLVDVDGKPVSREDVEIEIRTEETSDNQLASRTTRTYYTDSGGQVTVPYHINRARYGDSNTESQLDVIVVDRSGLGLDDATTVGVISDPLVWSRDAREPTTLVLAQTLTYHTAEASGARNRVTATLIDQYGDPVRGETVHFRSDDNDGLGVDPSDSNLAKENYRKSTTRRGEATVTYLRNSATPGVEDFMTTFVEDYETEVTVTGTLEHYWVLPAPQGTTQGELVHHDTRRSTFVYDPTNGPYRITYDSRDYYYQGTSPIGYDVFLERVTEEEDTLRAEVTSHRASDTNTFTRNP